MNLTEFSYDWLKEPEVASVDVGHILIFASGLNRILFSSEERKILLSERDQEKVDFLFEVRFSLFYYQAAKLFYRLFGTVEPWRRVRERAGEGLSENDSIVTLEKQKPSLAVADEYSHFR